MKEEIKAAALILARLICAEKGVQIAENDVEGFKGCFMKLLEDRFKDHWYEERPSQGQAYRSIHIYPNAIDPVIIAAARESKFSHSYFIIPVEVTLWIDPREVSIKFGDIKPMICTVMKGSENQAATINIVELLDTAKLVYHKQNNFIVKQADAALNKYNEQLIYFDPGMSSPPENYLYGCMEGYMPQMSFNGHAAYNRRMMAESSDGELSGSPPNTYFHASFTSSAVNTTPPRKPKGGNPRVKGGQNGRSPKNHHHLHHNHSQSESSIYNHNHNNNHNSNSSQDRFHWVRGSKGQGQQNGSPKDAK